MSRSGLASYTVNLVPRSQVQANSFDVILHCTLGDVGPMTLRVDGPTEAKDFAYLGDVDYLILIMYNEDRTTLPTWELGECTVLVERDGETYSRARFTHTGPIQGGDACVYSITLAPSATEICMASGSPAAPTAHVDPYKES